MGKNTILGPGWLPFSDTLPYRVYVTSNSISHTKAHSYDPYYIHIRLYTEIFHWSKSFQFIFQLAQELCGYEHIGTSQRDWPGWILATVISMAEIIRRGRSAKSSCSMALIRIEQLAYWFEWTIYHNSIIYTSIIYHTVFECTYNIPVQYTTTIYIYWILYIYIYLLIYIYYIYIHYHRLSTYLKILVSQNSENPISIHWSR